MKKVLAVLASVILVISLSMTTFAQTYFWLGSNSYSYNGNTYCQCKLNNPGKKNASVKVSLVSTGALTVRMTDANNRYIWGEDYAIKPNWCNTGSRTFSLGKDHSIYRIYFKSTNGKGSGSCNVSNPKNCTIK